MEVIKGEDTSEETFEDTCNLIKSLGKTPVKVLKDIRGFLLNRLQHAMWREAISLLQNGVADPEDIDSVVKSGFGLRLPVIGPLEYMDLVGLNLVLDIHSYLMKELENSTEPLPLLRKKVEMGELGVKSKRGFYTWTRERKDQTATKISVELINRMKLSQTRHMEGL